VMKILNFFFFLKIQELGLSELSTNINIVMSLLIGMVTQHI
jgi:hypothetical protein